MSYRSLLDPTDAVIALIDHQPQTFFGVESHDRQLILNNVVALAKTAKIFDVPVVFSTVSQATVGAIPAPITEVFPDQPIIDRTFINAWEDQAFREAVLATGRRQIIMAGLWTEMCLAFPVLSAREEGRDVFFVPDASGGHSLEAHELAVQRMVQAGAVPVDALTVLGEFQRDWGRQETYAGASQVAVDHGGAWGIGTTYMHAMTGAGKERSRQDESLPQPV